MVGMRNRNGCKAVAYLYGAFKGVANWRESSSYFKEVKNRKCAVVFK